LATSYEDLGAERFQELCQALLAKQYPRLICFPVGMPDGGRDAAVPHRTEDSIVFQIKFRRRTPLADATYPEYLKWLQQAIKSDISSLARLLAKGIKRYVVISNAPGSPHPRTGTMDQMRRWLKEMLPENVDFDVWWRADIDRRLEGEWDLKRSYGLTDSQQSSEALLNAMISGQHIASDVVADVPAVSLRRNAIRKFLRTQYDRDANIKFREADLPSQPLLQSYLDIYAEINSLAPNTERRSSAISRAFRAYNSPDAATLRAARRKGNEDQPTAARYLLHYGRAPELRNTVVEGAPGQGKSTLAQYLCQVHRARLLGRDTELSSVPAIYRASPILLPMRTDLRDLAIWLQGDNPFGEAVSTDGYPRSVEGFLAAMVSVMAGGATFTVDDLDDTIMMAPTLLVFDGLDEVAELEGRQEIVEQISECTNRLHEVGPDLQVIITSRPTAFSGAPQFRRDQFSYMTLSNLTKDLIFEYTRIWTTARKIESDDAKILVNTLTDKLREPHIKELAQNSMQLAILLWLMYQQTGSLPDQRTRLYEQYISTFLNREANKSEILRRHREPILQLHGYLAWILHARAEQGRSQGNIAEADLKDLLRGYLAAEGYSQVTIVNELFQGMVERVVALVSRVQGTYEFEVQPLREYFAAYYLYKTARYSPPGLPVTGTKADRFDAIARNPYWQNVTRFYVGFFDKGELSYLYTQFDSMFERGAYSHLRYPRTLANAVIADQVFGQSPGVGSALARRLSRDAIGWYALAEGSGNGVLALPPDSGGNEIVRQGMALLEKPNLPFASMVVHVVASLGDRHEVAQWWKSRLPARESDSWARWMSIGVGLDILETLNAEELVVITDSAASDVLDLDYFLRGGLGYLGYEEPVLGIAFLEYVKAGVTLSVRYPPRDIFELTMLMTLDAGMSFYDKSNAESILKTASSCDHLSPLVELGNEMSREMRTRPRLGRFYMSDLVRKHLGRCWLAERLWLMPHYYSSPTPEDEGTASENIIEESCSVSIKLRSALAKRDDSVWWQRNITAASSSVEGQMILAMALIHASEDTLAVLLPDLEVLVSRWRPEQTLGVLDTLGSFRRQSPPVNVKRLDLASVSSPELLAAIGLRARLDQRAGVLDSAAFGLTDSRLREYIAAELLTTCAHRLARTKRWVGGRQLSRKYAGLWPVDRAGEFSRVLFRDDPDIDISVAREILEEPGLYAPIFVIPADRTASREVARLSHPVAETALGQNWFDQPQPF
jgi:hypothetical protein